MTTLIFWTLAVYGLSNILVYGSIFSWLREGVRNLANSNYRIVSSIGNFIWEMLRCMMCTPTWAGFFMSIFVFSLSKYYFNTNMIVSTLLDGAFASGTTWVVNSVTEWYEENRIKH